jgi:hypothetical protein
MTRLRIGRFRIVLPAGIWLFLGGIVFSLLGTGWFLLDHEPKLAGLGTNLAGCGSLLVLVFSDRISIERG